MEAGHMNQDETVHPRSQKKLSEKIWSVVTSILLVLALLFCFSVVYQMQTKRFVSVFGCSVFRVITDSMEPEIPVGALIISKETSIEKIEVGDVICFRSLESYMNNSVVTHRVVGITEKNGEIALRTRGDSNNSEDGFYVTRYNLIGKVIYHTEEGSFITNAYALLTSGIGFFTLIVIPVIVITVYILHEYLGKIKKELQQMKEELQQNSSDDFDESDSVHRTDGENSV
jgi:signal peptidase I